MSVHSNQFELSSLMPVTCNPVAKVTRTAVVYGEIRHIKWYKKKFKLTNLLSLFVFGPADSSDPSPSPTSPCSPSLSSFSDFAASFFF